MKIDFDTQVSISYNKPALDFSMSKVKELIAFINEYPAFSQDGFVLMDAFERQALLDYWIGHLNWLDSMLKLKYYENGKSKHLFRSRS